MEDYNFLQLNDKNIALLIDGENISPSYISYIIDYVNRYGKINYSRVYGDWTTDRLKPWKVKCMEYGLTPIQQYSYCNGKNVSDFTLVIDAMDILYSRKVNCYCIVSSDSDFTKLVTRLKEDNIYVLGMGESKTPDSLVNSCDVFGYLDKIAPGKNTTNEIKDPQKTYKSSITPQRKIINEVKNIIQESLNDDGWANWSLVAQLFQKKYPGFHPRNYGKNIKPLAFFELLPDFEVKKSGTVVYIRSKRHSELPKKNIS